MLTFNPPAGTTISQVREAIERMCTGSIPSKASPGCGGGTEPQKKPYRVLASFVETGHYEVEATSPEEARRIVEADTEDKVATFIQDSEGFEVDEVQEIKGETA